MPLLTKIVANIGLQRRILLSVGLGLGVALGGFAIISLFLMNQSTDRALSEQMAIAQVAAGHMDQTLAGIVSQLQVAAVSSDLDPAKDASSTQEILARIQRSLQHIVSHVMLVDANGQVIAIAPDPGNEVGQDYSARPHVQQAIANAAPAIASAFHASDQATPSIAIAVPLRDRLGRPVAVLVGDIDLDQHNLLNFPVGVDVGRTAYLQLVDQNGLVLIDTSISNQSNGRKQPGTFTSHPQHFPSLIREGQPVLQVCHTCHQTAEGLQRGRDIMAFVPLSISSFGVAFRLAEEDVYASRNELRVLIVLYSIFVLGAGLFFAWVSTNAVVRPLESLTAAARRIGGGDLDSPVYLAGGPGVSETTTLAATIEAMRRRLRASYERIERLNRSLEERVANRTRELSILFEVSQTLTRTVDVDNLMQMVVEKIVSVVEPADAAILFRYDHKEQVLIPRTTVGYHLKPLLEVGLRPGEAMAGKVLEAGRTVLFGSADDVQAALSNADPRNAENLRLARQGPADPQAALGAPIVYEGETRGVLLLVNLNQPGTFDPSHVGMVQALADQVAIAIAHAQLVQEAGQVQALREADRLKSEFLFNVSHELRTPLASIVSLAEVLAADYRSISRKELGRVLSIVERSAGRLKDMVENLLDAGSIQAGRFRVVPEPEVWDEIVDDALSCVQPLLQQKEQAVEILLCEPRLVVLADRQRIVQVLVNLISNAQKYCPAGQRFQLSAERDGSLVRISVSDAGPGIAAEDQHHLFEPFYRSSRPLSATGAGLGLPIVKAIVEAHGGNLSLESRSGEGTIVSFSLPLAVDPLRDAPDSNSNSQIPLSKDLSGKGAL